MLNVLDFLLKINDQDCYTVQHKVMRRQCEALKNNVKCLLDPINILNSSSGTSSVVLPASHGLGRGEECGAEGGGGLRASQAEFGIFLEYLLLNLRLCRGGYSLLPNRE